MSFNHKLVSTLRVVSVLTLAILVSGCATVGRIDNYEREQFPENGASSESDAFQTATPPSSPDLRGDEFSVVMFVTSSDGYAHSSESIINGVQDGVVDLNARGGVKGAKITLLVVEVSGDTDEILETVMATLDEINPLVVLMAAPVGDLLYYEINHQEVPFLFFGLGGERFNPSSDQTEMLFWLVPTPDDQLSYFVSSLWANWDSIRPTGIYNELKIGYLETEENKPDAFVEAAISRLEIDGFEVPVRWDVPASGNESVTNFLIEAIQNGVTVLYSDTPSLGTAVLLNDIGSLALEDSFVVGGSLWSIDGGVEEILLAGRELDEYVLPISTAWWNEADNLAIQSAIRIHDQFGRSDDIRGAGYLIGLGSVDLIREAIQTSVIEKDSGSLSAKDIFHQVVRLDDYDVMGGLFTINYMNGQRAPVNLRLWQYKGSNGWVPISGWGIAP